MLIIPVTSIKESSKKALSPYEYDIIEEDGTIVRLKISSMRSIDKMRIVKSHKYMNISTSRKEIEDAVSSFFGFNVDETVK